jgi:hypothetical protein
MGKRSKKTYVREETFAELIQSAEQAFAYERGAREGYRVTQVAGSTPSQPISSDASARVRSDWRVLKQANGVIWFSGNLVFYL